MSAGKNKLLLFSMILLGALLVISCGAQPAASPTPGKVALPMASGTPTPASSDTPTVVPTETATVEPTPTTPPFTRCQEIIDAQMPKDFLTEGSIIFTGECEGIKGLYKLSAGANQITSFLGDSVHSQYNFGVRLSPDHQWLAVEAGAYDKNGIYLGDSLVITGENDTNVIRYPGNREWGYLAGSGYEKEWLGSQNLRIKLWRADISQVFPNASNQVLLDALDGKMSFLKLPDNHAYESDSTYYAADLTRLLAFNKGSNSYSLFVLATGRELWKSKDNLIQQDYRYQSTMDLHLWSPDNRMVAFPVWDDEKSDSEKGSFVFRFMVITRDGQAILSQPIQNYGYIFYLDQKPEIPFGWSNDSQYLIYWNAVENGTSQLTYWNPLTNEFLDPGFTSHDNYVDYPYFSPDGKKFVLKAKAGSDKNAEFANYLVDISTRKVALLDINLVPLGWMRTTQGIAEQKSDPFPLPPKKNANVSQICLNQTTGEIPKTSGALIFARFRYIYQFTSTTGAIEIAGMEPHSDQFTDINGDVSPDRKWLVYRSFDNEGDDHYWLYSLNEAPKEFQQNNQFSVLGTFRWRSNDEIWVKSEGVPGFLFNPFTQKTQELPDFPTQQTTDTLGACIDDLCALDYAGFQPYDSANQFWIFAFAGGYTLTDKEGKFLWEYGNPAAGFNLPKWQPGDQKLGIPMPKSEQDFLGEHYEIFTVDREGHQRQLTNYSAAFPVMVIDKFSWSPDGRYIAFWGDTRSKEKIAQQNPYHLFVFDTVTHHTIDYCVPDGYFGQFSYGYGYMYGSHSAPIWSPDGSQIAVNGLLDGKRQILLVDFASGTVSPVAEGELIGWMAEK
jgi:hypothetical protein